MTHTAIVYIAERCNQRCVFCLEVDQTWQPLPDFSTGQVVETLRGLHAEGADQVTFMGGETLFRKDFGEILAETRRLGFQRIGVTTNGTVLSTPGFLRRLMDRGLDFIELSLHGHTEALANQIGGTDFTFRRQARALAELNEIGSLLTIVNVVICPENKDHVVDIARYLTTDFPRIPARFKLKFVGLMGLAESARARPALRYGAVDALASGDFLAARGVPVAFNNFPLCRLGRHAARSLELADLATDEQYFDYDHRGGSRYVDTRYHLDGRCWPEPCLDCSLRPICCGIENAYRLRHGHGELRARDDDPLAILADALAAHGRDRAGAAPILTALAREPRPLSVTNEAGGAAAIVRLRRGGGSPVELQVEPSRPDLRAYATAGALSLSYRGDGDAVFRQPGVPDLLRLAQAALGSVGDVAGAAAAIAAAAGAAGWEVLQTAGPSAPRHPAPAAAADGGRARPSLC